MGCRSRFPMVIGLLAGIVCLTISPAYAYKARLANEFQVAVKVTYQEKLAADDQPAQGQIRAQQEQIDQLGRCAVQREVMAGVKEKPCKACPADLPSAAILNQQSFMAASHYVYYAMALEDQYGQENVNADSLRWQLEDSWSELRENLYALYEGAKLPKPETVELNRICGKLVEELGALDMSVREDLTAKSKPSDGGHFYE